MYEENVKRGAAHLDMYGPSNWRNKIDVEKLDMADSKLCILGQLYGEYSDGYEHHGLWVYDQREHLGFTAGDQGHLLDAWRKYLAPNPAAPTPVPVLREEITLSADDVKLLAKRMKQIQDPNHTLWSVELVIQGVLIKLGE